MNEAFTEFTANERIVYAALKRAGVMRSDGDYDDLAAMATERYVAHYREFAPRYAGADLNRLIAWRLTHDIVHARVRDGRRHSLEVTAVTSAPRVPPAATDTTVVEVSETLAALAKRLKPVEQAIVRLRYEEGLNNRELGERLHLTPARIGQLRKHIAQVYRELEA